MEHKKLRDYFLEKSMSKNLKRKGIIRDKSLT